MPSPKSRSRTKKSRATAGLRAQKCPVLSGGLWVTIRQEDGTETLLTGTLRDSCFWGCTPERARVLFLGSNGSAVQVTASLTLPLESYTGADQPSRKAQSGSLQRVWDDELRPIFKDGRALTEVLDQLSTMRDNRSKALSGHGQQPAGSRASKASRRTP
jgi:hypothetical protein